MPPIEPLLHLDLASKGRGESNCDAAPGTRGPGTTSWDPCSPDRTTQPSRPWPAPWECSAVLLPKLNHAIEFAPMNHDGADLHAGRRFEAIPTTLNQTADRFPSDAPDHDPLEEQR